MQSDDGGYTQDNLVTHDHDVYELEVTIGVPHTLFGNLRSSRPTVAISVVACGLNEPQIVRGSFETSKNRPL